MCVSVCVCVLKLLLDCSTDSLHFWRKMVLLRSLSHGQTTLCIRESAYAQHFRPGKHANFEGLEIVLKREITHFILMEFVAHVLKFIMHFSKKKFRYSVGRHQSFNQCMENDGCAYANSRMHMVNLVHTRIRVCTTIVFQALFKTLIAAYRISQFFL